MVSEDVSDIKKEVMVFSMERVGVQEDVEKEGAVGQRKQELGAKMDKSV